MLKNLNWSKNNYLKKNLSEPAYYAFLSSIFLTIISTVIFYLPTFINLIKYKIPFYLWFTVSEIPTGGMKDGGVLWDGYLIIKPISIILIISLFLIFFIASFAIIFYINKLKQKQSKKTK